MYPLTLGANIGTTGTAILAAMVSDGTEPLQVALAHLFFNITGIVIFYPIPFMRALPMTAARQLGKATRVWRGFPFLYIAVMFVLMPMVFLGLSAIFEGGTKGFTVLGSFITIILALIVGWTLYSCQYRGGKEACALCMSNREKKRVVLAALPEDMEYLKARMAALIEHTGLPVDDEEDEEEAVKGDDEEDEVEA
jgi:sodium-dependent phosphate cotransporter